MRASQEALRKKFGSSQGQSENTSQDSNQGVGTDEAQAFPESGAATRLAQGLDDLKGAAMKVGQMLSLADESMLPKGWKQALSKLQSAATPKPWAEVEPLLNRSIPHYQTLFASINPQAVHAASIGQVHKAQLLDGTPVALKIRYPDLETSVHSDLENMKNLFRMAKILPTKGNFDEVFGQIEELFLQELDFAKERSYYELYANKLAPFGADFIVPQVITSCCAEGILTTAWQDGENIERWIERQAADSSEESQHARNAVGGRILDLMFREMFCLQHLQTDPNPGNFLVAPDGRIILLDFGATQPLGQDLIEQYRCLSVACNNGTKPDIVAAGLRMGLLLETDDVQTRDAFSNLMALASEPFTHNFYCWKECTLAQRLKEASVQFAIKMKFRPPPPALVFLNRRFLGTQLLLEKLGPTLRAREILGQYMNGWENP